MRILANAAAITCFTLAALQLVDAEYVAAVTLLAMGVVAYLTRRVFPSSGEG